MAARPVQAIRGGTYNSAVPRPLEQRLNVIGLIAGPAAVLIVFFMMAGRSGPGSPHMGFEAVSTLIGAMPLAAAWMLAAIGLGWPLRRWLAPESSEPMVMQVALGVGAMLILGSALGRLGLLQIGGSIGAWLLIVAGWALLVEQLRRRGVTREVDVAALAPHWLIWTSAPALAVLLLATTSAPGWLWDTEYGGYDALSYHLQLPKEWLALGAIAPLEHNVYSFFPGAVEAAFYHLMVLQGDAVAAVYACQLLHAMMGIVAAWIVGRVVMKVMAERAKPHAAVCGAVAFVVMMGTPWVAVTGSMAYNEMAVIFMLAAGVLVLADERIEAKRRAVIVGLFAGAACAAKLTAIGFVAAPLALLLATSVPPRIMMRTLAIAAFAAALALSPYLVHNAFASGNPLFPFATGIFGTGHWTVEQAAIWRGGHRSDHDLTGRIVGGWHQLLRFGIGASPPHEERWHAQWSILPWLAVLALVILLVRQPFRAWGMRLLIVIAIQVLFWLVLTHIKSRFMVPMVVPAAMAIALALASFLRRRESSGRPDGVWVPAWVGLTAILWSIVPVYVFAKQAGGAPAAAIGMADLMTGDAVAPHLREAASREGSPAIYVNQLLPGEALVLFVGEAAPFHYNANYTYNTVWDRGPLSRLMREHPDDPQAWLDSLRADGYTHVLIDFVMLRRWEEASWNDPLITAESVGAATAVLELEHRWERGVALFRIP